MRTLITGIDAQGRSCVVSDIDMATAAVPGIPGVRNAVHYRTTESPPSARLPALADNVDVQLPPGILRLMVVDHAPHGPNDDPTTATKMHNTDALDIVYVVEGQAELALEDGSHAVGPGDCVVTPGVDHAWQAGPDGVRFLVFSIGTPRLQ
jgi:mannose-6-phosphate isomerase-like protein (cupin superfamily)